MPQADYGLLQPSVKLNTPFENLSTVLQLRNQQESARGLAEQRQAIAEQRRALTEKTQQENADRAGAGDAIRAGGGVRETTLAIARQNAPNSVPGLTEFFDKADEKANTIKSARQKIAADEADFMGDVADSILKHGASPGALKLGMDYTVEHFPDYAEQTQKLAAQLQGAQPEQIKAFLEHVRDSSPARRQKTLTPIEQAQLGGLTSDNAIKAQVAAGMAGGLTPDQQRQGAQAAASNRIAAGQLGVAQQRERREQGAADAASGASTKDLAPGSRDYRVAQDLASGDLTYSQMLRLYPSRSGAMAGVKAAIYDKARDLNPEFTPAAFEAGYKFATNPKTVQAVAAVDNVLPNIKRLVDLSNSWDRTKYPDLNKFIGTAQVRLGNTTVANIRQAQQLIGDELGTALGGGTMTDMKLKLGLDVVDPNLAPEVFMSNMARVEEFLQNRKSSLKTPMGHYAGQNAGPTAGTAPTTGSVTVKAPDGKTYTFASQAQADVFKKRAGIP